MVSLSEHRTIAYVKIKRTKVSSSVLVISVIIHLVS